ncbi:urease accessory protein UreE [Pleomorphomonas sp. JP5]|uniref:urease accessory protein UreE n=1 Tax=Pleomorphomonas sp. JP5 TaxID=2942998 RepID=UPI00204407D7|nr:urease accessory protein UreE [Pleomorphomonas sp. JP5]MCM5556640.1 urease accessory protein UreE [Pleomorphomonas sp. JP5]
MITATRILPAGTWTGTPADTLALERDDRHRRRLVMRCVGKTVFLLDLKEAAVMKDGDALELEDGRLILVQAVPERLLEIRAASPAELVRVAWHLGNRHLPAQFLGDRLRIRYDHVIEDMLKGLGATVEPVLAAFDPEGGAYGHGDVHGHDHHDHGAHEHTHEHGPERHHHDHGEACAHHHHEHAHAHDDHCGCGHDHAHDHAHGHSHKHE